jgi:transcriptional regulator with XRE-family HTH domain
MAKLREHTFGQVIRRQRRRLGLRQEKVACSANVSVSYVGQLESDRRHPSHKIVVRIANALGLDDRKLYFLANPEAREFLDRRMQPSADSSWRLFCKDLRLRRIHHITPKEMDMLAHVASLGHFRTPRSFIHILNAIRLTAFSEEMANPGGVPGNR